MLGKMNGAEVKTKNVTRKQSMDYWGISKRK